MEADHITFKTWLVTRSKQNHRPAMGAKPGSRHCTSETLLDVSVTKCRASWHGWRRQLLAWYDLLSAIRHTIRSDYLDISNS